MAEKEDLQIYVRSKPAVKVALRELNELIRIECAARAESGDQYDIGWGEAISSVNNYIRDILGDNNV